MSCGLDLRPSRMSVGVSPEGFQRQLHGGQTDVCETECRAEELTEQRQSLLHLPIWGKYDMRDKTQ